MRTQGARGYTLVEILTTLSIAIILSASTLALTPLLQASRAMNAKQSLIRMTQLAKSNAVGRSIRITVCPTANKTDCIDRGENLSLIAFSDTNQNFLRDMNEIILAEAEIEGRLAWNGAHNILRYRPDGTAIEFGTFTYCPKNRDNRYAYQLTTNAAGRSYFSRDRDGDGKDDRNSSTGPIDCESL